MSRLGIRQSREQVWAVFVFLALALNGLILNLLSTSFRKSGFHFSFPMSSALQQMQRKHSRYFGSQELVSCNANFCLGTESIFKRFSTQSQLLTLVLKITLARCTLYYNEFSSATNSLYNSVPLRSQNTPLKQPWSAILLFACDLLSRVIF